MPLYFLLQSTVSSWTSSLVKVVLFLWRDTVKERSQYKHAELRGYGLLKAKVKVQGEVKPDSGRL